MRFRKIKDGFLATTDNGSWAYLSKDEYRSLMSQELQEPLLSILKSNGLVIDNTEAMIRNQRARLGHLFQGTSLHIVVPTIRCNLKCRYCHACARSKDAKDSDMTVENARKAVDLIFQSPSPAITIEFQGGEPLLRFDLVKEITEYAKLRNPGKDLKFSLVTNLTLMSEKILEFAKLHGMGFCTSLDGPKHVHDQNRGMYNKSAPWIGRMQKEHSINAMLLATKSSMALYKEVVEEYAKHGLKRIWIKPVQRLGYAKNNWPAIEVTPEEYLDFYKNVLKCIVESYSDIVEVSTNVLLKKILTKECFLFTDLESPCGAAIGQLVYDYDGSVYSCDEGRQYEEFKLGTLDNSYKEIIGSRATNAILRASINDNPSCELCAYKPYCGLCPVCSYADTGTIISKVPDRRCRILMGMFDHVFDRLIFSEQHRKVFLDWSSKRFL